MKFNFLGMLAFFLGWQIVELVKAIFTDYTMKEYLIWGIGVGLIFSILFQIINEFLMRRKYGKK